jgi:hypothetical protein
MRASPTPNVTKRRSISLKTRNTKALWFIPIALIGLMAFDYYYGYNVYVPVLLKRPDLEASIKFLNARDIEKPGKIYVKDSLIFISDKYRGIHIINNADSTHPQKIGFINIPGCLDMAVKGNYLYADNAVDLVTIDISNLPAITVTDRKVEVLPEIPNPATGNIPYDYTKEQRPANTVIVNWIEKNNNLTAE